jgi:4'-phosphopantetheinyl transferase
VLSAAEHDRAAQIVAPARRRSWQLARVALRLLLGRYLGADPGAVELDAGTEASPPPARGRVEFGLAYSGNLALCAFSADIRVGVDLELDRSTVRLDECPGAADVFTPETARRARPHDQRAFLPAWLAREATLRRAGGELLEGPAGQPVWGRQLDLGAGRIAAVGASRPPRTIRRWRLDSLSAGRAA